jgi:hypothetical protein
MEEVSTQQVLERLALTSEPQIRYTERGYTAT